MRHTNRILAFAFITLSTLSSGLQASPTNSEVKGEAITETLGHRYAIQSKILAEQRELQIHLPKDYQETTKPYPVLYLLDGGSHFRRAITAVNTLQNYERMPDSIIVAIPNNTGERRRDVSTGRDNFIAFIKNEVMPYVAKHYRISDQATLFGHSSMGYVTLDVFANDNDLFDNYISASPAISVESKTIFTQLKQLFKSKEAIKGQLYFTVTDKANEIPGFTDGVINLANWLDKKAPKNVSWHYDFIPGQTHMTTPYLTLYKGLSKVFNQDVE